MLPFSPAEKIGPEPLHLPELEKNEVQADVLRLDKIHPVISGNKWFKLKYYLEDALATNCQTLLTYGGAWSNHIVATAFAAREMGLSSVGIIRGEPAENLSNTLQTAIQFGMQLQFISRDAYRRYSDPHEMKKMAASFPGCYIIPEGGRGINGIKGSREIWELISTPDYSHVLCAIGTGTMYCGLASALNTGQKIIGIPVLKGIEPGYPGYEKMSAIPLHEGSCEIIPNYHFGGYAKKTPDLIDYMNRLYRATSIPTDFVYTGKLFFAMSDLLEKGFFPARSKLLIIHSGGLQGNASLPVGELSF